MKLGVKNEKHNFNPNIRLFCFTKKCIKKISIPIVCIIRCAIFVEISIVAILISFSVAIITILVSADNNNIERLKETESRKELYKPVHGKQLSLFQILLSNIAYNVVTEIIYLVGLIAISLIQTIFPIYLFKYITSICIFIILHILYVLLESVSQMYLTFWAEK